MNYDRIINEEIDRFINEEILFEFKKSDKFDTDSIFGKKKSHKIDANSVFKKAESDFDEDGEEHKHKKKKEKKKEEKPRDVGKKAKKLKNGLRGEFNFKRERETNPNLNNQDAEDLATMIDSPFVNTAAVAHEWRPDLTPEGAQSELRKKVKGLRSDSGSKYRIKKKDAFKLRRILSKELDR